MQPHTKVYMRHFKFGETDFIPCEICTSRARDIHHINGRGKGKNVIENLIALCRRHHEDCHNEVINKEQAQTIHNITLRTNGNNTSKT